MAVIASFRAQLRARPERFVPVDDARDVERAKAEGKLAVAFDLEGGVPLGERPEMVQLFYDLGVRQIHLAYNRNNSDRRRLLRRRHPALGPRPADRPGDQPRRHADGLLAHRLSHQHGHHGAVRRRR